MRTVYFEARGPNRPDQPGFQYAPPREIAGLVRTHPPEVLVSHRHRAYRVGVHLARRLENPLHVVVAHEYGMFARATRRVRRRLAGRGHARFAGVSDPVAADLGWSGVDAPVVLPNVIDSRAVQETMVEPAQARAALGIPTAAFAIGVVGRLHPKKDPLRAARVFERYRRENPVACLVFLGDGPLRDQLAQRAGEGVVMAGFRADARTLLGAFDTVLGCSTHREGFGVALLEAMAAGVPVVVADQPGPRSVVGDCGTYFSTDEDLLAALRHLNSGARADTVEPARQRAATTFSVEALADRYRSVLLASRR